MEDRTATSPLRILVVEDESECADSMALLLRMDGHAVQIALNGQAALEKAAFAELDVVLLDLGLPDMSGYVVAQKLSAPRPRKTPLLIAVTGWGQADAQRLSAEAGIDLHLVKPVEPESLRVILDMFQRLLAG